MKFKLKNVLRILINKIGLDIQPTSKVAHLNYLGIASANITHVIDCGANEGQFAQKISKIFPKAMLYCFEPLPGPFLKLSHWGQKQGERVKTYQTALGDYTGTVLMNSHSDHSPSSSLLERTKYCEKIYPQTKNTESIEVPITTLDDALLEGITGVESGILLKLDVQGFEDRVLRGANDILRKTDVCILEVARHPLYEKQATFPELLQFLVEKNFIYSGNLDQIYDSRGHVVFFDAVFVREDLYQTEI